MGGRIAMLDQRPVAAIVYQHGNHFIHLFIWPASSREIDLNVRSDRGNRLCGWNKAGLNYLCITKEAPLHWRSLRMKYGSTQICKAIPELRRCYFGIPHGCIA
jgi:hypothetical protein